MRNFVSALLVAWLVTGFSHAEERQWLCTGKVLIGGLEVSPKFKNGDPIPDSFFTTCVELLQTSSILHGARLRVQSLHPDLQPQPCKLEVARLPGTRIIVLRTSAPDPAYARAYLDSVIDEFLAKGREEHGSGARAELDVYLGEIPKRARDIARADQEIKAAEQNGVKPDQLVEAKAKLQQDKMFYERLLSAAQKLEDRVRDGGGGEIFSVVERASSPVALQPGSSPPELLEKQK